MKTVISKLDIPSLIVDASQEIDTIAQQIEDFIKEIKNNG